jgi:hypothetical protein
MSGPQLRRASTDRAPEAQRLLLKHIPIMAEEDPARDRFGHVWPDIIRRSP